MSDESDNFFSDKIAGAPHPMHTTKIIGHNAQKLDFLNCFAENRIPQCWLLAGDRGIGKASFAWQVSKFLLTTTHKPTDLKIDLNSKDLNFILEPKSGGILSRITSGSEQRVHIVRRGYNESRKTFFKNISIDDIRKLQSYCSLSMADGGRRIIIIDSADDLNKSSGNALLKLLEEPPKNTLFLLISHQSNLLLSTIKSRCQKLSFSSLNEADLSAVLATIGCKVNQTEENALHILSQGSAGAACRLINSNGINLYKDILNITSSLPSLNINKTLQLNQDYFVKAKSNNFEIFFEMMQQFFSRLCKTGAMQTPILPSVSNEEEKIMTYLCPSPGSAYLWSEAANITLAKLNKGYFLNINIESLIMDAFIYLETCYKTISQNTVTNE